MLKGKITDSPLLKDLSQDKLIRLVGITVVVILVLFFVVRPAIQGYLIYSKVSDSEYSLEEYGKQVGELREELLVKSTNLTTCDEYNRRISGDIGFLSTSLISCRENLTITEAQLKVFEDKEFLELDAKIEELKECEDELDKMRTDNTTVIRNAARTICCMKRVENPSIDSYIIDDKKIACMHGGEFPISC